jgi:hypothetical protein
MCCLDQLLPDDKFDVQAFLNKSPYKRPCSVGEIEIKENRIDEVLQKRHGQTHPNPTSSRVASSYAKVDVQILEKKCSGLCKKIDDLKKGLSELSKNAKTEKSELEKPVEKPKPQMKPKSDNVDLNGIVINDFSGVPLFNHLIQL